MGALIMFALAIIIATAAVLYYWRQDRKEKKTRMIDIFGRSPRQKVVGGKADSTGRNTWER